MTRAAVVVGVVLSSAGLSGQQPAFSTRVESVRVDVLVLDGGRPVRGLGPADEPTVLVNTGGVVSLFMHSEAFAASAKAPAFAL